MESSPSSTPAGRDLDALIEQIKECRNSKSLQGNTCNLHENVVKYLCMTCREIFMNEPMLLQVKAPLNVCGDIHGQFSDLIQLFDKCGDPSSTSYLFLGDYVDRGKQSLETICLLFAYKIKYRSTFHLLRGNHESASINRVYGFYDECKTRYSVKIWRTFCDCFNCLPVAAAVDDRILCMHGGLSPELKKLEQIRNIMRPTGTAKLLYHVSITLPFVSSCRRFICLCADIFYCVVQISQMQGCYVIYAGVIPGKMYSRVNLGNLGGAFHIPLVARQSPSS